MKHLLIWKYSTVVVVTTCEERNLGLDRRVLVGKEFGIFKELINA